MNDEGVFRSAPATPGLLINTLYKFKCSFCLCYAYLHVSNAING